MTLTEFQVDYVLPPIVSLALVATIIGAFFFCRWIANRSTKDGAKS